MILDYRRRRRPSLADLERFAGAGRPVVVAVAGVGRLIAVAASLQGSGLCRVRHAAGAQRHLLSRTDLAAGSAAQAVVQLIGHGAGRGERGRRHRRRVMRLRTKRRRIRRIDRGARMILDYRRRRRPSLADREGLASARLGVRVVRVVA